MTELALRPVASRATHLLAIATVVVALPLILLGAEVTSKGVGMVDPVALRSPWYFGVEWMNNHGMGWLIEHGHRQVGWIVGMLAIATLAAAFWGDSRGWVRVLSAFALTAVIVQGLLGIFRIQLHALFGNSAALVHGSFAPIVLSVLLTLALASARDWSVGEAKADKLRTLRIWSLATVAATYAQIVFGGFIRHKDLLVAGRLHLIGAFVVFSFVWVVIKYAREANYESFKTLSRVLMALLTVQVLLGAEAWMAWMKRHFYPQAALEESAAMQLTRSAHYVVGAFIFATMVALTVKAFWAPVQVSSMDLETAIKPGVALEG
jgi:cytochrome c oxidase assembly protein subunit 15